MPARDDRVAAAKEAGDRDLARALARLRRPTKAAWLANLLARHRTEQLDGLVALARSLAQAQQELDGDALRALSGQRHRAVAAMARDAGRLAARRGEAVSDALLREVAGILDAALADPAVAEEVRAGRLTKTVRYSGFGPASAADSDDDMAAWAASAPQRRAGRPDRDGAEPDDRGDEAAPEPEAGAERERADRERAQKERAERERLAAERKAREQELADAEADEAAARAQQESDEAERDRADERHAAARDRVAELAEALRRRSQRGAGRPRGPPRRRRRRPQLGPRRRGRRRPHHPRPHPPGTAPRPPLKRKSAPAGSANVRRGPRESAENGERMQAIRGTLIMPLGLPQS